MLDFNKLVSEELLEEEELQQPGTPVTVAANSVQSGTDAGKQVGNTPAKAPEDKPTVADDSNADEKLIGDTLVSFLQNNYNDLKAKYTNRYADLYSAGVTFPTEDEFRTMVYGASKNSIRNTKDSTVFPDIRNTFPLLDLIARAKNEAKGHAKDPSVQGKLKKVYDDFIQRLNGDTITKLPLDYTPVDPWARTVRADFYRLHSNNVVGQLTLDKVLDKSVMDVVLYLLTARKQYMIPKLDPKAVKSKFGFSSVAYVTDLIFNFQKYGSGQIKVPANFALLYDQTTPRDLIQIGSKAYQYVIDESKRLGLELDESKKMEAFEAFVKNAPLTKEGENQIFNWSSFVVSTSGSTTTTTTTPSPLGGASEQVNASFSLFDVMYDKIVLNEYNPISIGLLDEKRKGQAARKKMKKDVAAAKTSTSEPTMTDVLEPVEQQPPTPEVTQEGPKNPNGGYVLKNISKDSELYKALLGLAEYIKTGPKRDITGALQSAASGARALLGKHVMG